MNSLNSLTPKVDTASAEISNIPSDLESNPSKGKKSRCCEPEPQYFNPDNLPAYISDALLSLRKAKNISQEKLAEMADITLSTYKTYEKGTVKKPDAVTLLKLANALGCSPIIFFPVRSDNADEITNEIIKQLKPTIKAILQEYFNN